LSDPVLLLVKDPVPNAEFPEPELFDNKVFFPYFNIIPIYFARHDRLFRLLWDHPGFKALIRQKQEEKAAGRALVREMEEKG